MFLEQNTISKSNSKALISQTKDLCGAIVKSEVETTKLILRFFRGSWKTLKH